VANMLLPQSFMIVTTHVHRPRIKTTYYDNTVVTVTFCSECKQELSRYISDIDDINFENLNTSTCLISVMDNIQVS
jgi:hypothetical protein